jgi:hypothetical protein
LIALIATAAVFAAGAAGAMASRLRSGARYDGIGQVVHFAPPQGQERSSCYSPSCALADVNFDIRLDVARSGREVKVVVSGLAGACGGTLGRYIFPAPASAAIRRDGTFRRVLRDGSPQFLVVAGRFLAHRRVRGTLRYLDCPADGVWSAYVRPLRPLVQQFIGNTDEGTPMMIERTVEPIPHVTRVYFASLQTNCGATPLGPLFSGQLALPVYPGGGFHVSVLGFGDNGFTFSGRFGTGNSASGTLNNLALSRGCASDQDVHWNASRVPPVPDPIWAGLGSDSPRHRQ